MRIFSETTHNGAPERVLKQVQRETTRRARRNDRRMAIYRKRAFLYGVE